MASWTPEASALERDFTVLSRSLMSETLDSEPAECEDSKEKVAGELFWIKNGSVSLSHFLAF